MKEAIVVLLVTAVVALAAIGIVGVHPTNAAPMAPGGNGHQGTVGQRYDHDRFDNGHYRWHYNPGYPECYWYCDIWGCGWDCGF